MSHIMEKTLASLPKLLSQSLIGGGNAKSSHQRQQPPPMDVQQFMRQIHKARTRSQEAAIVKSQLQSINQMLRDTNRSQSVARGCFTKIIFCHQLGHDVSEMAIHAIMLAQTGRGFDKRLGYLVSCLLLHSRHEVAILMTSTIMRDLVSSNMTDNCLGLKVAGELISVDMIPSMLPEVTNKFRHHQDLVKEKAINCFRCFYLKAPELLENDIPKLNVFLASRDPGVLMAVMNLFKILTSQNPSRFVGLSTSFMHILDQINSRAFGSVYYYHMVALPWLQISLLKILCNLAQVDSRICTRLEPTLKSLIEKTKVSVPISLALLVESIQTATKIGVSESLLQLSSRCIKKLMASESSEDMRYQGLGLLISLSEIKPHYAVQHQTAVMECLSSDDPAIQSRTTFLLYAMANAANVKVICGKLFEQHDKLNDLDLRKEVLEMVINLVEKLPVDIEWYVTVNFQVLSHDLGFNLKDRIVNSLIVRLEHFSQSNEMTRTDVLSNILKQQYSYLEKERLSSPSFSVRILLLGILVPLIPQQLPTEKFFDIITPIIFRELAADTNTKPGWGVMMNPAGHSIDSNNDELCSLVCDDEVHLKVQCVETVTKFVLAKCLDPNQVLHWLGENNYKSLVLNKFVRGVLQELEDLVLQPASLNLKSQIMFHTDTHDLDLSLSFLDPLIIQDMLEGGSCYTPKYVQNMEKEKYNDSIASAGNPTESNKDENTDSMSPLTQRLSSDKEKFGTVKRGKEKWRDDEDVNSGVISEDEDSDERFSFVDVDTSVNLETDKKRKQLAEELFAGLESSNVSGPSHLFPGSDSSAKPPKKASMNIWDDDDEDDSDCDLEHSSIYPQGDISDNERRSSFFKDLHPFGITKTKKAPSKPVLWSDDVCVDLAIENISADKAQASLYDLQDGLSYDPTYLYHQPGAEAVPDEISLEQETGLSMYSEYSEMQSPIVMSPENLVSAVDALTDSDPDGII